MSKKFLYLFKEGHDAFGGDQTTMKNTLGGKGAGLAEMTHAGMPVPQGFTITTEACTQYYADNREINDEIKADIFKYMGILEEQTGKTFGSIENPLLVSVRSGARQSMPGMMDTILNLGLNDEAVEGLAKKTNNARFAYDCYRRFVQMFADVVMMVPKSLFEVEIDKMKEAKGVKNDVDLTADDLKELVGTFKKIYEENEGRPFPQDPRDQLIEAVKAVFRSWDNPRANVYRKMNEIPYEWGTAVNVQQMAFGNSGDRSGTGVAFTRDPATEYVPLSTNDGLPVTQFNMVEIERLGLLKMDFLGLRTLTVIHDTELAVRRKDPNFRIANLDYDDPDTYAMLAKGETEGIFQLESTGMTQVLVGMRPKNLEDIIALISLYRPGPMDSIPTYLRNRKDPSHVTYKTPQMAHIVDVTNGVVIYQEQVMQICRELAGFSFGQADNVRRAMSKKKLKVMEAEREHFVHGCKEPGKECAGCVANGVPENIANEIYDDMISFASYAFNKSHAACYAYVAFQTAYLKCHYPHEFMAALLTSVLDNTSKVIEYTTECQRLGIKVQQPDINVSRGGFTADGERIRFGLNAVKSVGRDLIEAVIKERAERPYSSLYDFCKRLHGTGLNRRALENLVKAGAFDTLEPTRHGMLESVEGILKSVETDARQNLDGQMDLFGLMGGGENEKPANDYKVPNLPEYSASDLLKMEKEVSGLYLSGHPLDAYRAQIAQVSTCTIAQLLGEDAKQFDNQTVTLVCTIVKNKIMTTKSNTLMAFTTVEDLTGSMELLVFPRILAECRAALQENAVVVANGRVSVKEDEAARLIVEGVQPIETYDPGKNFGMNRVERVKRETSGGGAAGYFLTVPSRDSAQMHKVENLLCNIFDGGTVRVYFRFQDTGRAMLARHMAVKDDPLLRAELERILGKDCVKVQDVEHSAK